MPLMIEKKELKRITSAENARNEMQIFADNQRILQEARLERDMRLKKLVK
jgi:hypothetical protein